MTLFPATLPAATRGCAWEKGRSLGCAQVVPALLGAMEDPVAKVREEAAAQVGALVRATVARPGTDDESASSAPPPSWQAPPESAHG